MHMSGGYAALSKPKYTVMVETKGLVISLSNVAIDDQCIEVKPNKEGNVVLYNYRNNKKITIEDVDHSAVSAIEKPIW